MKEKIARFISFTETDKWKKILTWTTLFCFVIYFFIAISAYATWFPKSTHFFVYSSTSGKILRAFISILVIGVGLLTMITFRKDIKHRWLILFGLLIFFNLLSAVITPTDIYTLYTQNILYNFLSSISMHVSAMDVAIGFLSFAVDIIFGYMLLFVYPRIFDKKIFLTLFFLFLGIMLYSFLYSFVKQKDYYKNFLSGNWSYQADTIGSIFGNKQQWGIFLSVVPPVASLSIFLVRKLDIKRFLKILFIIAFAACMVFAFFCSIVSFCKTAILSSIFFFLVLFICLIINLFFLRKKKILPILLFVLLSLIIGTILCFNFVPSLKATKVGEMLDKILKTLISSGTDSADNRLFLVITTLQNYPSINFFIGIPKGIFEYYGRALTPELANGLHTGIAIYFCRTGIFGLTIYVFLLVILIIDIVKIFRGDKVLGGILFGSFVVSVILNLSELEILIMSSSMNVLMLNLVLVLFTRYYVLQMEEKKNEEINL